MRDRVMRAAALLLVGGLVLVLIGLTLLQAWPTKVTSFRVDGLSNGVPEPEPTDLGTSLRWGGVMGGVLALIGSVALLVGSVAAGVRLAISDRA